MWRNSLLACDGSKKQRKINDTEQVRMDLRLDCLSIGMDNQYMLMSTEHLQCATKGSKWLSWDWAWGPQLPITVTNMSELKQAHLSITIWNLMQIATKQGMPTKHTFFSQIISDNWLVYTIWFENRHASECIPAIQKIVMTISRIKLCRSSAGI